MIYKCYILLLCSVSCHGYGDTKKNDNFKSDNYLQRSVYFEKRDEYQENDRYQRNRYHENSDEYPENNVYGKCDNYGEEYFGNPDLDAIIERPCRVFDLNCIRRYFAEHSKCKIRRGPLPRNLFITQESLYYARINMTATLNNVRVSGIRSTRIEEFYINRRTNKMVFSINIRGLTTEIPTVYFQFYRNGSEPIVIVTEAAAFYPSVTFTAVIPNIDEVIQLDKAEITPYVDSLPAFYLGPALLNNTNPTVTQTIVEFLADIPTDTQELMLTESQFYPPAYIQYNICDFGLKVLRVDFDNDVFRI